MIIALTCLQLSAQDMISPPYATPNVDGIINAGEYSIAEPLEIQIPPNRRVKVLYAYDSEAFYFAFYDNLESSNTLYPEVLINVHHEEDAQWDGNDWFFHVGGTDCFYNGQYGVFNNCQLSPIDWAAEPNILQGGAVTDTVEMRIPFAKIQYSIQFPDTLGIAFLVTNNNNMFKYWPSTADKDNPGTWATLYFPGISIGVGDEIKNTDISVYPNPATDRLFIRTAYANILQRYTITDLSGRVVDAGNINAGQNAGIDIAALQKGIYMVDVQTTNGLTRHKIVKQ